MPAPKTFVSTEVPSAGLVDQPRAQPAIRQHSRRTLLASAMALTATAALADDKAAQPDRDTAIIGPRNPEIEKQNPDFLDPPKTDHGAVPNLKFSFAETHRKIRGPGGWSREITQRELPIATTIAGVNMRLSAGGVRELHWHKEAEWSFMLAGTARITAIDQDGHNFVADVGVGDLWFFPSGIPHSIQGLSPDGCEFLLAFADGSFSEDNTFAITDMFAHMPKQTLAKNLGIDPTALDKIPAGEKFIFQAGLPPALQADMIESPAGRVPQDMKFQMTKMAPTPSPGGSVRIVDTRNFPISTDIAAALVEVQPGHMRETHWHPQSERVAVLHRRAGPYDGVRRAGQRKDLRLSGRRRRLRAEVDAAFHREHRQHHVAFSRAVPLAALFGCLADAMDGADAARTRGGPSQYRPPSARSAAERQACGGVTALCPASRELTPQARQQGVALDARVGDRLYEEWIAGLA